MNWIVTMILRLLRPPHQPDFRTVVADQVQLAVSREQLRMLARTVEHAEYCPSSCDFVRARAELRVLLAIVRRRLADVEGTDV